MKIIHCLWDDKFMDGTIRVYEADQRHSNDYVFVTKHPEKYKFRSIKNKLAKTVSPKAFLSSLHQYDVVVLHSFSSLKNSLICKIPNNCKVVWYAWGLDLYGGPHSIVPISLYNNETFDYIKSLPRNRSVISSLYCFIQRLYFRKAISRVNFFSGVFPYEYELVKKFHPYFNAKPVDFYYGDTDFFIKDEISYNYSSPKNDIIIGNSADPCNNHHDALTELSKIGLPEGVNIIIPLSYAGNPSYAKWVKDYAESLFPGRVKALLSYLPLNEYIDLISSCRAAIFFHERQQASDNIFMQMLYGAKVYMSETSLAYKYLKDEGFLVYSLQSEVNCLFDEMPIENVVKNRDLLVNRYSEKTILSRVTVINDILNNEITYKD